MNKTKPITPENMHALTMDIIKLLKREDVFSDINIYVNNKHYASNPYGAEHFIKHEIDGICYYENRDPVDVTKQIEYNNPKTITITFEGPLYHHINYGNGTICKKLNKLAEPYGLYYELGYAWSMTFYEI